MKRTKDIIKKSILLLLLGGTTLGAWGQKVLAVTWAGEDGHIYEAKVSGLNRLLPTINRLWVLSPNRGEPQKNILDYSGQPISWLVYEQDTLIRRVYLPTGPVYLQLLQSGALNLYRVIDEGRHNQFIVGKAGKYEVLSSDNLLAVTQALSGEQSCRAPVRGRVATNLRSFLQFGQELNECLRAEEPAYVFSWLKPRHRIGLNVRWHLSKHLYLDAKGAAINFNDMTVPPSLTYERWLPYRRGILALHLELQSLYLGYQVDEEKTVGAYYDRLRLFNIYALPGLKLYTGGRYRLRAFVGGGAKCVTPLLARKDFDRQALSTGLNGRVVSQQVRHLQRPSLGYYGQLGLMYRMNKLDLSVEFRGEKLRQVNQAFKNEQIVRTAEFRALYAFKSQDLFSDFSVLWQVQIGYNW